MTALDLIIMLVLTKCTGGAGYDNGSPTRTWNGLQNRARLHWSNPIQGLRWWFHVPLSCFWLAHAIHPIWNTSLSQFDLHPPKRMHSQGMLKHLRWLRGHGSTGCAFNLSSKLHSPNPTFNSNANWKPHLYVIFPKPTLTLSLLSLIWRPKASFDQRSSYLDFFSLVWCNKAAFFRYAMWMYFYFCAFVMLQLRVKQCWMPESEKTNIGSAIKGPLRD